MRMAQVMGPQKAGFAWVLALALLWVPWTAQGGGRSLGVDSENGPQQGQFLPDSPPHSAAMRQEAGNKWAAAAHLQPTLPRSEGLLGRGEAVGHGIAVVRPAELPPEARTTYALIFAGGPFPHEKDGTVFGNRERLLPLHKRGYYREYTVTTPGSPDRGTRRIVCGGKPRVPDICYYTSDHYTSFRIIGE